MARPRRKRALLDEFLDALALEGRSPHSVRAYRRDLEPLVAALPARLDQVRPADLREHFRAQQQAGRSPSSINRAIAAARSFFNFLLDKRVLAAARRSCESCLQFAETRGPF
jgi:integrase/recombinase XerC